MTPSRREFLRTTGFLGAAAVAGDVPALATYGDRSRGNRGAGSRTGRPGPEAGRDGFSGRRAPRQEVRRVATPVLEVAFEEHGSGGGFPILLLHGFPYDVRAWDGVPPPLVEAGYRVIVPWLRGYGPTRFLDPEAPRMAEQAAIAQDVIDLADALGLDEFAIAGFDWGNRAACIAAILHPDRIRGQVAVGGYSVQNTIEPSGPAPPRFEALLWYQWYFNTDRGRRGLEANRRAICRYLWETWSPGWDFSDEAYEVTAEAFENPDFVDVVIHSYRHRHGNAPGEERFLEIERRLAERPPVPIPAMTLHGLESGFGRPSEDPSGDEARFPQLVDRRLIEGAGHDLPQQRPDAVAEALLDLLAAI